MNTILITSYVVTAIIVYIICMYIQYSDDTKAEDAVSLSFVFAFCWPILLPLSLFIFIVFITNKSLYKIFDYIGKFKVVRREN